MFYVIETLDQLEAFKTRNLQEVFIEVIPSSYYTHPIKNEVSLLYVRSVHNSKKGYVIAVNHTEALNINVSHISALLKIIPTVYVRDKKDLYYYFPLKKAIDITFGLDKYSIPFTQTHTIYNQRFPDKNDVNRLIPIAKHYEMCEQMFHDLKPHMKSDCNDFFNTKAPLVFFGIEQSGIKIDKDLFSDHFYDEFDNYIYTQYNYKTLTTRPSNRFDGINYAALPKESGCKEAFIARNDQLIQFDFTAYHPNIVGKLMKYDFKGKNIYDIIMAECGVDYDEAKKIVFRNMNGKIYDKYKDVTFFKELQEYTDQLWTEFNANGFIEDEVSKYRFYKSKLEDMNPSKLLNYRIQCAETSVNILMMIDMFKILKDKKSKLIYYQYDSFTIDLDEYEEDIIKQIETIFSKYGFPFKVKTGKTLNF